MLILRMLLQRLAGASLLVFVNKQDIPGSLTAVEIRDVSSHINYRGHAFTDVFCRHSI